MAPCVEAASVGRYLQAIRLDSGVPLPEVASATRIGSQQLAALEADAFDELPAPVFVRGFIRAYCGFLGTPAEEALALYDREHGTPAAVPQQLPVRRRPMWLGHPLALSGALLLIFGGGLVTLRLVGGPAVPQRPVEPPAARERAAAREAVTAATAIPPPAPAPAESSLVRALPRAEAAGAQRLVITAIEPTWVRVQVDEGHPTDQTLEPGTRREWTAEQRFLVTVGNAGGIEIQLNGKPLPALGPRGAVIHRLSLPERPATGS
jgi:cytoskeleton protein RodZ